MLRDPLYIFDASTCFDPYVLASDSLPPSAAHRPQLPPYAPAVVTTRGSPTSTTRSTSSPASSGQARNRSPSSDSMRGSRDRRNAPPLSHVVTEVNATLHDHHVAHVMLLPRRNPILAKGRVVFRDAYVLALIATSPHHGKYVASGPIRPLPSLRCLIEIDLLHRPTLMIVSERCFRPPATTPPPTLCASNQRAMPTSQNPDRNATSPSDDTCLLQLDAASERENTETRDSSGNAGPLLPPPKSKSDRQRPPHTAAPSVMHRHDVLNTLIRE